ncbi:HupE/UreJ family protein [Aureimonas sp. SA4125]|uniref:HupE/UreJ family protein n=1 Tax=Aureimonas sp. SA4125 TaxID=2826993 RepID=UPI001CC49DCE|nr:HupE/UreJ family protein [Aureimonas sp. SA4125]
MSKRLALAAAALLAGAAPAFAHVGTQAHSSFLSGFAHPLSGLDHILAMVAVGLWAAQLGGRALYAVPAAFVGAMALGFILGASGLALPFVEPAILASVIVLGLVVATAVRVPLLASAGLVGLFALAHGAAHASEIGTAGALSFSLGFVAATALLHGAGIGLGLVAGRGVGQRAGSALSRTLGAGTAIAGVALMIG